MKTVTSAEPPSQVVHARGGFQAMLWGFALFNGAYGLYKLTEGSPLSVVHFGSAGLLLFAALFYAVSPVLRLFEDRVEWKATPLAPRKGVYYRHIAGVRQDDVSKVALVVRHGNSTKSVALPMWYLDEVDRDDLIRELRYRARCK